MACGDYMWGRFRQGLGAKRHCTGETGCMRLVMQTIEIGDKCRTCQKIDTKKRSIRKEEEKIKRWNPESGQRASIEQAEENIYDLQQKIYNLEGERQARQHLLWCVPN